MFAHLCIQRKENGPGVEENSDTLVFSANSIAPHLLELVKLSCLSIEDMNNSCEIIHENPFAALLTFDMSRTHTSLFSNAPDNVVGNTPGLRIGIPFTDDEEISGSVIKFSEIQLDNVLAFDVLNTVDDQFVQFLDGRVFCGGGVLL